MKQWIKDVFDITFLKRFNTFMLFMMVGIVVSFFAISLDHKHMIQQGYIYNIFLGTIQINNNAENKNK